MKHCFAQPDNVSTLFSRAKKMTVIKKYKLKTSKHSTQIIRTKMYTCESERKMMIRMIHDSLLICEKINRIVQKKKKQIQQHNNE